MAEERKVNVVKLGEFKLNEYSVLVVNKTDYSGEDKVDFRIWKNTSQYKGPTKQGFVLSMDQIDDFIEFAGNMKEILEKSSMKTGKKKKIKK